MRVDADPDFVLIERMLAPPPLAEARSSLEFWRARRNGLPIYRRRARREAAEMVARCQERVRAAQLAQFEKTRFGRLLLALGVPRFWAGSFAGSLSTDRRVLAVFAWRLVPRRIRVVVGATAAVTAVLCVAIVAALVLTLAQSL